MMFPSSWRERAGTDRWSGAQKERGEQKGLEEGQTLLSPTAAPMERVVAAGMSSGERENVLKRVKKAWIAFRGPLSQGRNARAKTGEDARAYPQWGGVSEGMAAGGGVHVYAIASCWLVIGLLAFLFEKLNPAL